MTNIRGRIHLNNEHVQLLCRAYLPSYNVSILKLSIYSHPSTHSSIHLSIDKFNHSLIASLLQQDLPCPLSKDINLAMRQMI